MIAKGTPHKHGAVLARYLVTGKYGERAELSELRGFAAADIVDAFRSVHVMARGTRCEAPFFHVYVRNADADLLDRAEWQYAANCIERILGLTDQPRAIAFHIAEDSGQRHMHIAWSRIDPENLRAKPLPYYKRRLMTVSRELERRLGITIVPNERSSSIKYAPTRPEEEQARRLGFDIHEAREIIRDCFELSDCGRSFQSALARDGMMLARGDRRDFVVVDAKGGTHAIGKRILGVSAAELRTRFSDLSGEKLPTVDEARAARARNQYPEPNGQPPLSRSALPDLSLSAFDTAEISNLDDRDVLREMHHGALTSSSEGQQEKNANEDGDAELGESCEVVSVPQPRLSAREDDTKTSEAPLLPRTETKAQGLAGTVRSLFRAVMKAITRRGPCPQPQKSSRKEETGRGFKAAARSLFRRVASLPIFHGLPPAWDAFTWLRIWEYDGSEGIDCHQDRVHNNNSDISPHP